jgi:hypothetical protein
VLAVLHKVFPAHESGLIDALDLEFVPVDWMLITNDWMIIAHSGRPVGRNGAGGVSCRL